MGTIDTPGSALGPLVRLVHCALWLIVAACGGSGDSLGVPRALREQARTQEVVRFSGFTVPGLDLYRVSGSVPDHGWANLVGVDARGSLVERAALMRRMPELPPRELAVRALGILLGRLGAEPLAPDEPLPMFATADEWEAVHEPRVTGGSLVFYVMQGEMSPELTEITVDLGTYRVGHRSAVTVLVERGRTVPFGPPTCRAVARCGCWQGCERLQPLRVPGAEAIQFRPVSPTEDSAVRYVPAEACEGDRCARECWADAPTARCEPALERVPPDACGEACPPSEAPFHCESLAEGCRRVDHPVRAAR